MKKSNLSTINIHVYHSRITHESRMLKETKSIADAGLADQIFLIGRWAKGLAEHEQIDDRRQIWRVRTKISGDSLNQIGKLLRYVEWLTRIFLKFRKGAVRIVNCHSIMELPLALPFKLLGSKIIYDTHELETEIGETRLARLFSKLTEKTLIHLADAVITVNASIAEWYRNAYNLKNVCVVHNIPYQTKELVASDILKQSLGVPDDVMLFIYQGGLEFGRGIDILLEVFERLPPDRHLVFMGMGTLAGKVKEYSRKRANIHFHDAAPPGKVQQYTSSADVGVSLIENVCLSYYFSSPNKLFEIIMAGIPVIASDFPEMRRVVDKGQSGWTVPVDCEAVFALISKLTWDDIRAKRQNALEQRKTLGWHNEERVLLEVYNNLGFKKRQNE